MGGFFNTRLTKTSSVCRWSLPGAARATTRCTCTRTLRTQQAAAVAEWRVTAALPAHEVEPIEVPLLPLTDSHVTGEVSMPTAGDWELRFTFASQKLIRQR